MENGIRERRKELGLSQEELAKKCGVSRQTVNAIENNKYDPTLMLAFNLARELNTTVDKLFVPFDSWYNLLHAHIWLLKGDVSLERDWKILIGKFTENEEPIYQQTVKQLSIQLCATPSLIKPQETAFPIEPYTRIFINGRGESTYFIKKSKWWISSNLNSQSLRYSL